MKPHPKSTKKDKTSHKNKHSDSNSNSDQNSVQDNDVDNDDHDNDEPSSDEEDKSKSEKIDRSYDDDDLRACNSKARYNSIVGKKNYLKFRQIFELCKPKPVNKPQYF